MKKKYLFPFEKLKVWQLAKELVLAIYKVSRKFPLNEQYGLSNQIKRSAISVVSNLAEGSARFSQKDQAHFSQIAYSSLMEVICQLDISKDLDFIEDGDYENIRQKIMILSGKINALCRSQKKRALKIER